MSEPPADAERELPLEQIFDGRFAGASIRVHEVGRTRGLVHGRGPLIAGYAMAEVALGARVRLIGGAR